MQEKKVECGLEISRLLALRMSGGIRSAEQEVLNEWLQKKEQNEHLYHHLFEEEEVLQRKKIIHSIDLDQEWRSFQNAVQKKKELRVNWRSVLPYAAVILFPLLIALFLIVESKHAGEFVAHTSVEIYPGVKSAQLILSNGERVDLDQEHLDLSQREKDVKIENKNARLNYTATEDRRGELQYNYLLIGRGEEYQLVLSDGTKVWLNSESKLKYPTQFADQIREVELEGEGYFEVTKNAKAPFVVKTKQMSVEVLGTSFNVSAYKDESRIKTTLLEGSVKVFAPEEISNAQIIRPDQQAIFDLSTRQIAVEEVDAQVYGQWREGVFAFEEARLDEIMRILSRWYKMKVFYENSECKELQFSGKLPRFETCNELLEMIEKTTNVSFTIHEDHVVVVGKK